MGSNQKHQFMMDGNKKYDESTHVVDWFLCAPLWPSTSWWASTMRNADSASSILLCGDPCLDLLRAAVNLTKPGLLRLIAGSGSSAGSQNGGDCVRLPKLITSWSFRFGLIHFGFEGIWLVRPKSNSSWFMMRGTYYHIATILGDHLIVFSYYEHRSSH